MENLNRNPTIHAYPNLNMEFIHKIERRRTKTVDKDLDIYKNLDICERYVSTMNEEYEKFCKENGLSFLDIKNKNRFERHQYLIKTFKHEKMSDGDDMYSKFCYDRSITIIYCNECNNKMGDNLTKTNCICEKNKNKYEMYKDILS
jgi:hypothetical protein